MYVEVVGTYICKGVMCVHVQYSCCVSSDMECDAFDNPADFFLDRLNEAENDLKPPDPESKQSYGYLVTFVSYVTDW